MFVFKKSWNVDQRKVFLFCQATHPLPHLDATLLLRTADTPLRTLSIFNASNIVLSFFGEQRILRFSDEPEVLSQSRNIQVVD